MYIDYQTGHEPFVIGNTYSEEERLQIRTKQIMMSIFEQYIEMTDYMCIYMHIYIHIPTYVYLLKLHICRGQLPFRTFWMFHIVACSTKRQFWPKLCELG